MDNFMISVKRFLANKNTVTIIGVIVILILLFFGYSYQINNAVEPIHIPVATETIQPRTEITDDMVKEVDVPNIALSENVIRSKAAIVGKYSNINSVIPEGSMFYKDTVISEEELPDSAFVKVKAGEIVYNFPVDMDSTYGNSIFPGNKIDMYMKAGNGSDEKIMVGKLIENIEVLAVKDSTGHNVFENTSEDRTPAYLIFGVKEELHLLLRKASYMSGLGVELFPVPHGGTVSVDGSTNVSTQQLVDYIEAHAVNIPVTNNAVTDSLEPTVKQEGNELTITYPKGCEGNYVCSYTIKYENGQVDSKTVTKTKAAVSLKGKGKLTAFVKDSAGVEHNLEKELEINNVSVGQ